MGAHPARGRRSCTRLSAAGGRDCGQALVDRDRRALPAGVGGEGVRGRYVLRSGVAGGCTAEGGLCIGSESKANARRQL